MQNIIALGTVGTALNFLCPIPHYTVWVAFCTYVFVLLSL